MEQLHTVSYVAKLFSVTPATVRQWLSEGTLRGQKIGKGYYWRIPASAIVELANKKYGDDNASTEA